jgi:phosphate transport system permease protein
VNRAASGDVPVWLAAGAAAACFAALLGALALIGWRGLSGFWPPQVVDVELHDGSRFLGEAVADDGAMLILRTSETGRIGANYVRLDAATIAKRETPPEAFTILLADGRRLFSRGDAASPVRDAARGTPVVDTFAANSAGFFARSGFFFREAARFLTAPAAAGGALPALVGTVTLVLMMALFVMPLGIATAIFLHERRGWVARLLHAAIANLAGVPSILYGVLGLGLFVHGLGAGIDRWLFADRLPVPTFGSGNLLWAALTLALLTLPVVVVSVEQGLARIPPALAAGSLALGATRGETIWRLLLPAARPALLTGLILAIARAAGAVAPLMLVGVVKLAPALPVDGDFPYLHPSRQFMHLGFGVYDAALASPDLLRGVSHAFASALLLVALTFALNLVAIVLRARLRGRYLAMESG